MIMWNSMSALICSGLARGSFWMPSMARPRAAICSGVARSAAWLAAAGSMISRISKSAWMKSSVGVWSSCQWSTSESSMFQSAIGRTRVPILGRDAVSPLAESEPYRLADRRARDAELGLDARLGG